MNMGQAAVMPLVAEAGPVASAGHWTEAIPESRRRPMRVWLWSVAAMTFAVLIVGGITRLTLSGLSIVDWQPLMGVIPPLTDAQWQATFELYRQFPEYQTWRQGMTLSEFKFIFFWEYFHRLLARGIGLVFLVPFVVFWVRGWFTSPMLRRALLLFGLGAAQGVMGWLMVKSGLVDRPSVSHFRLAAHLSLAFLIFGWAVWLARDLATRGAAQFPAAARRMMLRGLAVTGVLLAAQVVWGAFVAGLRAGKFYPTFPLMGGRLTPPELLHLEPVLYNFVANPASVQWVHRVLGTLLAVAVVGLFMLVREGVTDPASRRYAGALAVLMAVQYALGIATLLLLVPVSLGVIHQGMAMVLFGVWLCWLHRVLTARVGVHGGRSTAEATP
ncbi:MAG TPA: COX15/CtaA family protein [Longimicrobiales bacterium]|nr:COX15/CtaA family protein [Longimicrobiales bacterium]